MSSGVSSDFSGLIGSMKMGLSKYLPDSSEELQIVLESSALMNVSHAVLKNLPFAFLAKEFEIHDIWHHLSARITFLEATMLSIVSTINSIFFSILYSCLSIATIGLSKTINYSARMHLKQMVYGCIGSGISALGVISTYSGCGLHSLYMLSILRSFNHSYQKDISRFEKDFVEFLQAMTKTHGQLIYNFTLLRVGNENYERTYRSSLEYIEARIHQAKRMDDLVKLASDIWKQWPYLGALKKNKNMENSPLGSPAAQHHYGKS